MSRVFAFLLASAAAIAETISLGNGVQMQISTSFGKPTGAQTITAEMSRASGNSFYRVFRDQNHLAVFAYELFVTLSSAGDRVMVSGKPAGNEFYEKFPLADGGKPTPTFSADHPYALASGQSIDIGLFEFEGLGLKVIDTIKVNLEPKGAAGGNRLTFSGLQVTANRNILSTPLPAAVSGKFVMFFVPGRGGYFFSAEHVPGKPFVAAGTVNGNRMQFTIDNEVFDAVADAPILSSGGSGEVWIYHDAAYKPQGNWTQDLRSPAGKASQPGGFFTAASDSLSWWLR